MTIAETPGLRQLALEAYREAKRLERENAFAARQRQEQRLIEEIERVTGLPELSIRWEMDPICGPIAVVDGIRFRLVFRDLEAHVAACPGCEKPVGSYHHSWQPARSRTELGYLVHASRCLDCRPKHTEGWAS